VGLWLRAGSHLSKTAKGGAPQDPDRPLVSRVILPAERWGTRPVLVCDEFPAAPQASNLVGVDSPLLPPPWVQSRVQHRAVRWYRCAFPGRQGSARRCRASSFSPHFRISEQLCPDNALASSRPSVAHSLAASGKKTGGMWILPHMLVTYSLKYGQIMSLTSELQNLSTYSAGQSFMQ